MTVALSIEHAPKHQALEQTVLVFTGQCVFDLLILEQRPGDRESFHLGAITDTPDVQESYVIGVVFLICPQTMYQSL